jgi:hypothetical protein
VQSPYETLIQLNHSGEEKKMICIVILVGILTASAYTANAQDASGNPEAGRLLAREVCSRCHAVTRAGFTANYRNRAGFSDHCQYIRNDGDRASRVSADAATEDAKPYPHTGAIGRGDRLCA